MTREQFIRKIIQDPENPDELLLDLGEDLCAQFGWAEGDQIEWTDLGDGAWQLQKKANNDEQ
jgi:hypothetical protein